MGRVFQAMAHTTSFTAGLPAWQCSPQLRPCAGPVRLMQETPAREAIWTLPQDLGRAWTAFDVAGPKPPPARVINPPPPRPVLTVAQPAPRPPEVKKVEVLLPPPMPVAPAPEVKKATILPPPMPAAPAPSVAPPRPAAGFGQLSAAARNEYKQLRNALVQAANQRKIKTFLLCGVEAENGVAQANRYLAEALAVFAPGRRVAHLTLPDEIETDTEEALQSVADLGRQLTQHHTAHDNLREIALPQRALTLDEAVSGGALRALIGRLKLVFDYILVDAPPLLPNPDTVNLATHLDSVILVARQHKTKLQDIAAAQDALRQANVEILGLVFHNQ